MRARASNTNPHSTLHHLTAAGAQQSPHARSLRRWRRGGVISRTEAYFAVGGIAACVVQLAVQTRFAGEWGEPNGWRIVMGLEAVPGLVMLLGALKCVESPHWLLRRGMSVEAERVLRRIYQPVRLKDGSCDCEDRNADMTDALDTLARGLEARFFKVRLVLNCCAAGFSSSPSQRRLISFFED